MLGDARGCFGMLWDALGCSVGWEGGRGFLSLVVFVQTKLINEID